MVFVLKCFVAGWVVLVVAMLANALAAAFNLLSWYDMVKRMQQHGATAISDAGVVNLLWLFLFYPLLLGIAAWLGIYLLRSRS